MANDSRIYLFTNLCNDGSPFWDHKITWLTETPTFTTCFIDIGLSWPPIILLWIWTPYMFYEYFVRSKHRMSIGFNCYNGSKFFAAIFLLGLGFDHAIQVSIDYYRSSTTNSITNALLLSVWLNAVTYLLFTILLHFQRKHGFLNCGCNWFYLLSVIILNAFKIVASRSHQHRSDYLLNHQYFEYGLQVTLFFFSSIADRVPNIEQVILSAEQQNNDDLNIKTPIQHESTSIRKHEKLCPKEMASVPSKLTFWWFNKLTFKGWRRPLTADDLWRLPIWNRSEYLFQKFNAIWKHPKFMEQQQQQSIKSFINDNSTFKNQNPHVNLWYMFAKMFWPYFLFPTILRVFTDLLQLSNSIILKYMINFTTDANAPFWQGLFFSFVFMLTNVIQSLSSGYQTHRMTVLSMRMRAIMVSVIYRKTLVIASHAKKNYSTGEIVNLMAVDSQRFTELVPYLCFLWTAPIQISIGLFLLYRELGPSVIGGVILMVAMIPLNSIIANQVKKIQRNQMKLKDQRLKMINEMLNGIKVLKLYAWESAFLNKIGQIRINELSSIRLSGCVQTIFICFGSCSPFLVAMLTFSVYVALGGTLTAEKAFVSITLFNLLRLPLIIIPNLLSGLILTIVSMKRINVFLNQDETDNYVDRITMDNDDDDNVVSLKNASFSWSNDNNKQQQQQQQTLSNITMNVAEKKLVAIVGPVGSGKSSLLHALLGEMPIKHSGTIVIDKRQRIGYVAQQAWIQNLTIRDNILFGQPFDPDKYQQVIDACALKPDFEMLGAGDKTEIGEKGINLSGGQKQRVSIARACYSDCNLLLFDDPLSAVDSHVGKHIFDNVLSSKTGILRNNTRILVTNALYVLPFVDQIVLMKNGRIDDIGTYETLSKNNENFQELMNNYTQQQQQQQDDKSLSIDQSKIDDSVKQQRPSDLIRSISQYVENNKSQQQQQQTNKKSKNEAKLVEKENIETGMISWSVFRKFIMALSPFWSLSILLNYVGSCVSSAGSNFWLSIWTDRVEKDANESQNTNNLIIYFVIGFLQIFFVIFGWLSIIFGTLNASRTLHHRLLSSIVRAPMHFFDSTPLGRIVNRFSKDIDVLDNYIQFVLRLVMNNTLQVLATLVIISIKTPIFLAFVIPFMILYFFVQRFYVATSRQLKRIESVSRSPIFTHFSETIQGVTTIKAYAANKRFIRESNARVDHNLRCFYPSQVANCWLQIRLEFMANCLVFFSSFLATVTKQGLTGSSIGLSLSYALNVTLALNWCVRMFAEMENNVVAVERISEYTDVKPEAEWNIKPMDDTVSKQWPEQGAIQFNDYATRYRPNLDLVLKGIDLDIKKGEKIGIVGRTGAGKSSLTLALFRIVESSNGSITIDGVPIEKLGLHKLRSRITIIPQDPVLFCGSLRFNLDPFDQYTDQQLWRVIELSHLKPFVQTMEQGLNHTINEGGENLSIGQRQLVCLARALLRSTNVLVLDEATAAVDVETDDLIQATIRKHFQQCTVLTIAHRLRTILDSDRVLVLDAGKVAEFDSPERLLSNECSQFYSLAKDAGIVS